MQRENRDMASLWDMLDGARAVVEFTKGMEFSEFLKDRKTRNAVERNLEIIGEAARRISQQTRDRHPDIPWQSIVGLRNILIHEFDEIRHEKIWQVCQSRLPELIELLEKMGVDQPPSE